MLLLQVCASKTRNTGFWVPAHPFIHHYYVQLDRSFPEVANYAAVILAQESGACAKLSRRRQAP